MTQPALTIQIDEFLPHPVPKVWRALTDPDLLGRWLMPNDFKLQLGHRFTFRTTPMPWAGFDGIIHCQVLAIEPLHTLQLAWRGGLGLDSRLTWRIEPEGDGTRFFLEHTGFDPDDPAQCMAHEGMSRGWRSHVLARLRVCLATLNAAGAHGG
jgi:uncharacterized protein YndB with AHSA1/START domain